MTEAVFRLLEDQLPELYVDHPERLSSKLTGDLREKDLLPYTRVESLSPRSGRLEGVFTFDFEHFAARYSEAESLGSQLEAVLLGYPYHVEVGGRKIVFDSITQNRGPSEIPWDDDTVHRFLSTYAFSVRRH